MNRRDAPFRSKMERWGHPFLFILVKKYKKKQKKHTKEKRK